MSKVGSTAGGGGRLICGNWWWWFDLRQLVVIALDGDYCGVTVVVRVLVLPGLSF